MPIPENEIIILFLGTSILGFMVLYRIQLTRLPAGHWLLGAYCAMWLGWVFTIVEHLLWQTFFNFVEHLAYALSCVLLFVWCWLGIGNGKVRAHD